MLRAFQEIRALDSESQSDIPIRVHTKTAYRRPISPTPNPGSSSNAPVPDVTKGSFSIDTTLGRESIFGILVDDADDYFIKGIQFSDSEGKIYGPYSSLSSDFNVINLKTINFPQDTTAPPFDDVSSNNDGGAFCAR